MDKPIAEQGDDISSCTHALNDEREDSWIPAAVVVALMWFAGVAVAWVAGLGVI